MSRFEKGALRKAYSVGVFVDSLNIFCACRDKWGRVIDHAKLMQVALAGHDLHRAIVYAVRFGDKMDHWIKVVQRYGFDVKVKDPIQQPGGHVKADWDTDIVIDILRLADQLDVVVIATGDGDFCGIVRRCQELGKIVRVIGVESSSSNRLMAMADEFVPVTEDMLLSERTQRKQFGKSLGVALRQAGVTPESVEEA